METSITMKGRADLFRDIAVGASGACAMILHLLAERWGTAVLAAVVAVLWIVIERKSGRHGDWLASAAFLVVGALLVWRFNEARLWLSVTGMWLLVSAGDLSRLSHRFPVDSPPLDQRYLVLRRLKHLALVGAASAVLVLLGRVLTLEIRLPAVALLAVFVVIVTVRTITSIADGRLPGNDEEMGR